MERDERTEETNTRIGFTSYSDTLEALRRAAAALEAALRESSRLSRRGDSSDGVAA